MQENDGMDPLVAECFSQFEKKIGACSVDSRPVIAMNALLDINKRDDSKTMQERLVRIQKLRSLLIDSPSSSPGICSSLEIMMKFTFRDTVVLDYAGEELRKVMTERFEAMIREMKDGIRRVGESALAGLQDDGNVIVTRGWSPALVELCAQAIKQDIIIQKVYILHGEDQSKSLQLQKSLLSLKLDAVLVEDQCAAFVLQKSNLLVVDCDSVSASGGVFVEFGMLNHMIVARSLHVDVLALGSMYKLTAESPFDTHFFLRQQKNGLQEGVSNGNFPHIEFCPPEFVSQVFTETGTLVPGTIRNIQQSVFN